MTVQTCEIAGWLPDPIANGPHGHWSQKAKKLRIARQTVWGSVKHAGWLPVQGKAHLEITYVFPQKRRRDVDGLVARSKGVIDGIVDAGVLADDSIEHLELTVRAVVEKGVRATRLVLGEVGR